MGETNHEAPMPLDARIALGEAHTWDTLAEGMEQKAQELRMIAQEKRTKAEEILTGTGASSEEAMVTDTQMLIDNHLWLT